MQAAALEVLMPILYVSRPWPRARWTALMLLSLVASCTRDRDRTPPAQASTGVPAQTTAPRTPTSEGELHQLITELAAAKACEMIRGKWTGIRDAERPTVTGTLWIRGCDAIVNNDRVDIVVNGSGWQWLDLTRDVADTTSVVRGTERFDFTTDLQGTLAVTYDPRTRTAALLFNAIALPRADLVSRAGLAGTTIDQGRLRSAILGAIVGAFAGRRTPESVDPSIWQQLGSFDITATVPLCLGDWFVSVGSKRETPELGEAPAPIDVGPNGLTIHGPLPTAGGSVSVVIDAQRGAPRAALMCQDDAQQVGKAFLDAAPLPRKPPLATAAVTTPSTLRAEWPHCPVMLVVSSTDDRPSRVSWRRHPSEFPLLKGPAVSCSPESSRLHPEERMRPAPSPAQRGP